MIFRRENGKSWFDDTSQYRKFSFFYHEENLFFSSCRPLLHARGWNVCVTLQDWKCKIRNLSPGTFILYSSSGDNEPGLEEKKCPRVPFLETFLNLKTGPKSLDIVQFFLWPFSFCFFRIKSLILFTVGENDGFRKKVIILSFLCLTKYIQYIVPMNFAMYMDLSLPE